MDLQTEKQNLIEWISKLEDESIIEDIKMVRESYSKDKDWWDELSEEQKKSIERGLKDVEEGRVIPYEQVKEKIKKWLTKYNFQLKL